MPRRRTVAIVSLAALIALAPFLPRAHDNGPRGRITPVDGGAPTPGDASGYGAVTPAMQAEIDRVVGEGLAQPATRGRVSLDELASREVRCATFEGLTYCLGIGWTEQPADQVEAEVAAAARAAQVRARSATTTETTGDLDPAAQLQGLARISPQRQATADRAELTEAARSVAKVWVLRHEVLGEPYPEGFVDRHPEVAGLTNARAGGAVAPVVAAAKGSASTSPSKSPTKAPTKSPTASPTKQSTKSPSGTPTSSASSRPTSQKPTYPRTDKVLDPTQVQSQIESYWCGPTSMQMIAWGWKGSKVPQATWAKRLGTTTSGTAISSIVSTINTYTGWDRPDYAGPYITLDIGSWTYHQWYTLIKRHITDYHAPIVMHPILLKKYFPYLDDDASGHYQVGRGYNKRGPLPNLVGYFEPWDQSRFDPSEPYIDRVQWRSAYMSYRANRAHPYHNIGV